jgi:hypothetical protein
VIITKTLPEIGGTAFFPLIGCLDKPIRIIQFWRPKRRWSTWWRSLPSASAAEIAIKAATKDVVRS